MASSGSSLVSFHQVPVRSCRIHHCVLTAPIAAVLPGIAFAVPASNITPARLAYGYLLPLKSDEAPEAKWKLMASGSLRTGVFDSAGLALPVFS